MLRGKQTLSYAPLVKEIVGKSSVIKAGKTPVVVVPLDQWHEIEDILSELGAKTLAKDIVRSRSEHVQGKSRPYISVRKSHCP